MSLSSFSVLETEIFRYIDAHQSDFIEVGIILLGNGWVATLMYWRLMFHMSDKCLLFREQYVSGLELGMPPLCHKAKLQKGNRCWGPSRWERYLHGHLQTGLGQRGFTESKHTWIGEVNRPHSSYCYLPGIFAERGWHGLWWFAEGQGWWVRFKRKKGNPGSWQIFISWKTTASIILLTGWKGNRIPVMIPAFTYKGQSPLITPDHPWSLGFRSTSLLSYSFPPAQNLKEWVAVESDSVQPELRKEVIRMMSLAAARLAALGATVNSVSLGSQQVHVNSLYLKCHICACVMFYPLTVGQK